MPLIAPSNSRGPILDLVLPPSTPAIKLLVWNPTAGRRLYLNLPKGWAGEDLSLDFYRRTIKGATGVDRSALLDPVEHDLWTPEPLVSGENDIRVEAQQTAESKSIGFNSAGSAVNSAAEGAVPWTNPGNAKASDNARATAAVTAEKTTTQLLIVTDFGFAVPAGLIRGIEVKVEKSASLGSSIADLTAKLVKAGAPAGENLFAAAKWNGIEDETVTYGTPTNLWGLTLTPADVNSAAFGFALAAVRAGGTATAQVDQITMKVHYMAAYGATATLRWEKGYY